MSRLTIDTGTEGNAATGDSLRAAFTKVNTNFAELYTELGGDSLDAISFNNNTISTDITNANLILTGNGTGGVVVEDLEITGSTINSLTTNNNLTLTTNGTGKVIINALSINEINSNDSSAIQVNDGLNVSGAIAASSIVANNLLTGIKTSTIVSGVLTLDFTFGTHIVNHNSNITSITFTNASAVKSSQVTVILTQDGTGGRTITGAYSTAGGLGLDISTTANAVNIVTFLTRDNSTFYGFSNGKNFS